MVVAVVSDGLANEDNQHTSVNLCYFLKGSKDCNSSINLKYLLLSTGVYVSACRHVCACTHLTHLHEALIFPNLRKGIIFKQETGDILGNVLKQ